MRKFPDSIAKSNKQGELNLQRKRICEGLFYMNI